MSTAKILDLRQPWRISSARRLFCVSFALTSTVSSHYSQVKFLPKEDTAISRGSNRYIHLNNCCRVLSSHSRDWRPVLRNHNKMTVTANYTMFNLHEQYKSTQKVVISYLANKAKRYGYGVHWKNRHDPKVMEIVALVQLIKEDTTIQQVPEDVAVALQKTIALRERSATWYRKRTRSIKKDGQELIRSHEVFLNVLCR